MRKIRDIGTFAAIGSLTATVAFLTGLATASADELADLRANQQLLQQRIDQLAQVAPFEAPGTTGAAEYGAKAAPGVPLLGGSFPRSFLIPGTDTSLRIGGFVDATFTYWFQGGTADGIQTTDVTDNGVLHTTPLNVHAGQIVPGLQTPGQLIPTQIQASRGNSVFSGTPGESRLFVETRTPTAWGEARTYVQFDFYGCQANGLCNNAQQVANPLMPRLLYAYGTLGGLLVGQANSNFSDPDAGGETLDFGGDVGQAGVVRIMQARYTIAGPWGSAWSASLETPNTDVQTPAGRVESDTISAVANSLPGPLGAVTVPCNGFTNLGFTTVSGCSLAYNPTKASAPDITGAWYFAQPWGHVDFRAVFRPTLSISDGMYVDQTRHGYGGGVSGDFKPLWFGWQKDDVQWQVTAGQGLGRYLNEFDDAALETNWLAPPSTPAEAAAVVVKRVPEIGVSGGYQHWWLPNLRSNLTFGYSQHHYDSLVLGPVQSLNANKQLISAHANLIWTPVAFTDIGIEYFYGQRQVVAGLRGQTSGLLADFRMKF